MARVIGLGLAVGCYAAVLMIAAQLTEETTAAAGGGAVATTAMTAPVAQSAALRGASGADDESPALTLAIAGASIAGGGAWRLLRVARRP